MTQNTTPTSPKPLPPPPPSVDAVPEPDSSLADIVSILREVRRTLTTSPWVLPGEYHRLVGLLDRAEQKCHARMALDDLMAKPDAAPVPLSRFTLADGGPCTCGGLECSGRGREAGRAT